MIEDRGSTGDLRSRGRLGSILTASLCAVAMVLAVVAAGCGSDSGTSHPSGPSFTFRTNGQGLWVANGTNVLEFTEPYKSHTPNVPPSTTLDTPADFTSAQGVLFDSTGDLWVIDRGSATVAASLNEFTAAQLAVGGAISVAPTVLITSPTSLSAPKQAAFDSSGNMWVTNNTVPRDNAGVVMFNAAALATSGAKVATAAIENTTVFAGGPLGIAFDSAGNLWVANNGNNTIMKFTKGQLPTAGAVTITPTVILSATSGSIDGPWGLEFDAAGDLWTSNFTNSTVAAFAAASLATTGSPVAAVTLKSVNVGKNKVPSLSSPTGIDFDGVGDLAVANAGSITGPTPTPSASPTGSPTGTPTGTPTASPSASPSPTVTPTPGATTASIAIFAAKQLTAGGAVAPQVLLTGSSTGLVAPAGVVFGPVSAATPSPSPSASPTPSGSPTASPSPTATATATP